MSTVIYLMVETEYRNKCNGTKMVVKDRALGMTDKLRKKCECRWRIRIGVRVMKNDTEKKKMGYCVMVDGKIRIRLMRELLDYIKKRFTTEKTFFLFRITLLE